MARDAGNTRRTARRISVSQRPAVFRDSLSPTDRDDFFRFVVNTRSSFSGQVFGIPRGSNFDFQIQNASGRNIARSARRNSQSENINVTLDPGTYFARVFWRQGQGPYRMRLSLNPDDSSGGNGSGSGGGNGSGSGGGNGSGSGGSNGSDGGGNDFGSASAFPGFGFFPASIQEYVGDSDPVDYYTFTTTIAGDLKIDLTDIAPTADLNITLFDQFQQVLDFQGGAGAGGNEQIIYEGAPPGQYFVLVETAGPGNNSTYRLTAVLTPEDKFGNDRENATPITGSPPEGIPVLSNDLNNPSVYQDFVGAGDIDVFRFELTEAKNFFSARLKDFTGNITLQLFKEGNETPLSGGGSALRGALGPGTYFLRVLASGPNDASTYTLEAAFGERESGIIVRDVNPGAFDANADFLTDVNGVLFFAGEDGTPDAPVGLWRSEGTLNTTVKVGSFTDITGIANVNGTVYIAGSTTQTGMKLWKWQPGDEPLGTLSLVADIAPGPALSSFSNLTAAGSNLFFLASPDDNPTTRQLYFTNGGAPVAIANAGESIRDLVYVQATDTLYYVANQTGVGSGLLFRVNNASTNPSAPVRLENLGSSAFSPRSVDSLKVVGGDLFFVASELIDGDIGNRELRRIAANGNVFTYDVDGDPTQGSIASGTLSLAVVESGSTRYVYFTADEKTSVSALQLFRSNLEDTTTIQRVSTDISSDFVASNLTVFNGKVYFTATTSDKGEELWVTDPAGPLQVTALELVPGGDGSSPDNLVVAGGTLYFTAETPTTGRELYRLNSSGLPELALDINPGPEGSEPTNLIAAGSLSAGLGQLFFVANDGVNGREVWTV